MYVEIDLFLIQVGIASFEDCGKLFKYLKTSALQQEANIPQKDEELVVSHDRFTWRIQYTPIDLTSTVNYEFFHKISRGLFDEISTVIEEVLEKA